MARLAGIRSCGGNLYYATVFSVRYRVPVMKKKPKYENKDHVFIYLFKTFSCSRWDMKSSLPIPEDLGLNREHYWTYGFASSPSKVSNPINSLTSVFSPNNMRITAVRADKRPPKNEALKTFFKT